MCFKKYPKLLFLFRRGPRDVLASFVLKRSQVSAVDSRCLSVIDLQVCEQRRLTIQSSGEMSDRLNNHPLL